MLRVETDEVKNIFLLIMVCNDLHFFIKYSN
jgi:hypothetical protein